MHEHRNMTAKVPRKVLATTLLAALSLLVSACVPLSSPEPTASSSFSSAPAETTPITSADEWKTCTDPVIKRGKSIQNGPQIISVVQRETTGDSIEESVFLEESPTVSISFDAEIPEAKRFNNQISEALDAPVEGKAGNLAPLWESLRSIKEHDKTLAYHAIEPLNIAFTMTCGSQTAHGELHTWERNESGILDCDLDSKLTSGSAVELVYKEYCPKN